jgi:thiol-disulfide isomerase/thioredoxin
MNTPVRRSNRRAKALLGLLVVLIVVAVVWGRTIQREIFARAVLNSETPSESAVEELIASYHDPIPFLTRLWKTGKVAHRQLAMEALKQRPAGPGRLDPRIETLLVEGAADSDASVRELALSTLSEKHSPLLAAAARAQLANPDPQIRLLGVQYLGRLEPARQLPILIPLLDDPDLRVVTAVESALRRWTGIDNGVRIAQAIPRKSDDGTESLEPAGLALLKTGIEQRKSWWKLHQSEYPSANADAPPHSRDLVEEKSPAADFALPDLSGQVVRLSDLRGRMVVLNFWATWCSACLTEIPDLVELQKRYTNRLAIIGISLDGVPDDHGHVGGTEGADSAEDHRENAPSRMENPPGPSLSKIQTNVARVAKARGITYRVLLDPGNTVGSRFNGGELPTNVLIDPAGNVRRRFIGTRSLAAWEGMIAEMSSR